MSISFSGAAEASFDENDPRRSLMPKALRAHLVVLSENGPDSSAQKMALKAVQLESSRYQRFMMDRSFQLQHGVYEVVDCLNEALSLNLHSGLQRVFDQTAQFWNKDYSESAAILLVDRLRTHYQSERLHLRQNMVKALEIKAAAEVHVQDISAEIFGDENIGLRMAADLNNQYILAGIDFLKISQPAIQAALMDATTTLYEDKMDSLPYEIKGLPAGYVFGQQLADLARAVAVLWKSSEDFDDAENFYNLNRAPFQSHVSIFNSVAEKIQDGRPYIGRLIANHLMVEDYDGRKFNPELPPYQRFKNTVDRVVAYSASKLE